MEVLKQVVVAVEVPIQTLDKVVHLLPLQGRVLDLVKLKVKMLRLLAQEVEVQMLILAKEVLLLQEVVKVLEQVQLQVAMLKHLVKGVEVLKLEVGKLQDQVLVVVVGQHKEEMHLLLDKVKDKGLLM